MNKIIAENIRTIREMRNFTRDFVAGELDMTASGYGKIERGEIDITISKITRLADVFGISLADLLFFDASYFFNNESSQKAASDVSFMQASDVKVRRIDNQRFLHNEVIYDKNMKMNSI